MLSKENLETKSRIQIILNNQYFGISQRENQEKDYVVFMRL